MRILNQVVRFRKRETNTDFDFIITTHVRTFIYTTLESRTKPATMYWTN